MLRDRTLLAARRWVVVVFALGAAATGLLLFNGCTQHERAGRLAEMQGRIEVLKTRQVNLKGRFDALLVESEKAPNDPVVLKALGTRHLELVKEDQALKNDLGRLQRDLDAVKR